VVTGEVAVTTLVRGEVLSNGALVVARKVAERRLMVGVSDSGTLERAGTDGLAEVRVRGGVAELVNGGDGLMLAAVEVRELLLMDGAVVLSLEVAVHSLVVTVGVSPLRSVAVRVVVSAGDSDDESKGEGSHVAIEILGLKEVFYYYKFSLKYLSTFPFLNLA
jgi:hypothetical protein